MNGSAMIPVPTLWDLATIVLEEVERVCRDERSAVILAREVLIHIIQGHVTNMEVEWCASDVFVRQGKEQLPSGPCPRVRRR